MSVSANEPIKVLMLLNRVPYPLNDGGAIGAFNFVKGYAEAGHSLTLLVMNTSKHFVEESKVKEVLGRYGKVLTVRIDNRINPLDAFMNLLSNESYIIQRFISSEFQEKLKDVLQQHDFDVVHIDGLPPTAYIDTVRAHSKAKVSMRAHNVEHVIWERIVEQEKNPLKKIYLQIQSKRLKKYEINALSKCDLVLAISGEDETILNKCVPGIRTLLVPAGMEIDETLTEGTDHSDIFFIGSFDWQPNLQGIEWFFENVWKAVQKRFPSIQFVIAGKKMPESIRKFKSNNVLPLGEVPDAKQFILDHGIMVVPLVSGSGIRIKIVEAMALGKTIIATTIAAEGLGLTDGENILIADTAPEFIEQLNKCLHDVSFRKRIGQNAHRFALENFQNKRIFEKLTAHYRQL